MAEITLILNLIENDIEYFQTFSDKIQDSECALFYNPRIPNRYDANKAMFIRLKESAPEDFIDRILSFYRYRNLIPRIELDPFVQPENLEEVLIVKNWNIVWNKEYSIMTYNPGQATIPETESIKFEIKYADYTNLSDLIKIRLASLEEGEPPEIYINSILFECMSGRVQYYIVYEGGSPISKGCLFKYKNLYRIENISTIPEFRNRGAARFLVNSIIKDNHHKDALFFLFVEPGTIAEKLYRKIGFETIFTGPFKIYTGEI
ncbi:MAG: GNAT family N-acetyltransferase [bacterium]|nr:GNAT family N-acetyltransferase [bacterium]